MKRTNNDSSVLRQAIGGRLAQFRQHLGMSQKELSESICIVWRSYQNYELGIREASAQTMTTLASVHGLNCDWLLTGRGHMLYAQPENAARQALKRLMTQIDKAQIDVESNKLPDLLALVMGAAFRKDPFSEDNIQELLKLVETANESR
ncbi:MAG: helix-turn-helix domain-containing protein [Cognatishimia sp.]